MKKMSKKTKKKFTPGLNGMEALYWELDNQKPIDKLPEKIRRRRVALVKAGLLPKRDKIKQAKKTKD